MSENTPQPIPTPTPTPTATPSATPVGSPKFWPAFLLCLFLGVFGAHRFYLKSPKKVLMLLTFGGLGLWAFIDCLVLLLGKFKDETGAVIPNPKPVVSWTVFGVFVLIGLANGGDTPSAAHGSSKLLPNGLPERCAGTYIGQTTAYGITAKVTVIVSSGTFTMIQESERGTVRHTYPYTITDSGSKEFYTLTYADDTITLDAQGDRLSFDTADVVCRR